MSHFTVLVKVSKDCLAEHNGDIKAAVAQLLAPYQENNMGDCPVEFMKFNDVGYKYRAKYETDMVEMVVMPDGELVGTRDDRFVDGADKCVIPDEYERRQTPVKHVYPTFEKYMSEYAGYEVDSGTGQYGYWENPNAKWDWWQIGGRWCGILRVKNGATGTHGERSLLSTMCAEKDGDLEGYLEDDQCKVDAARVGDIDFDSMNSEVDAQIGDFWANYQEYLVIKRGEKKDDAHTTFSIADTLQDLGVIKCIEPRKPLVDKNGKPVMENGFQKLSDGVWDEKELTIEDLKTSYRHHWEFGTYAVLDTDGKWYEKGEMGWFGMSSESPDEAAKWNKSYMDQWIRNEDLDTTLVVVDCHI